MSKRGKRDTRGRLQRALDREEAERAEALPITAETRQHGDYHALGTLGNARTMVRNRGGTTVDRWIYGRRPLTEAQQAGIAHAVMLWERAAGEPRMVANLQREVRGFGGHEESDTLRRAQARADLARIELYIASYTAWDTFMQVVRFDNTIGLTRAGVEQARAIVERVSDEIALRERLVRGLEAA